MDNKEFFRWLFWECVIALSCLLTTAFAGFDLVTCVFGTMGVVALMEGARDQVILNRDAREEQKRRFDRGR